MKQIVSDVLMFMVDNPVVPAGLLAFSILALVILVMRLIDRATPDHDTTENQVGNIR